MKSYNLTLSFYTALILGALSACTPPKYSPALSPEASLESFQLVEGFEAEIFAAEPFTTDPVEMVFDEKGNVYVVEMPDYPFKPEVEHASSRVRMLLDTDGDGRIDSSTVFADGLMEATSILPWKGSLLVCAAPDIFYFKDTNGDHVADVKEVLFKGFFGQNSEIQITNLRYGLDNWIYAANYGQKGKIYSPKYPEMDTVEVQGADFRFRLEPFRFEAAPGITQFGHDQDDWGHRLVTQNTLHARHIVIARKYLLQNPLLRKKQALRPTYQDGTRMFQLTPPPHWRAVRTSRRQKRYDEAGKGRIEHASNHFTGCSGTSFYLADAFPASYYGSVFTGDVAGNLIHRDVFIPMKESPSFHTQRPAGETEREFLASTDSWFRPANFTIGPDGYLYVVDMYRQHIETPLSIPEDLKEDMDFNKGNDKGRIYRIRPKDSLSLRTTQIAELSEHGQTVLSLLSHKNRWNRLQAQRLIVERQEKNLIEPLSDMMVNHPSPIGRIHALYTLEGLGGLTEKLISLALADENPGIRENAIKLAENYPGAEKLISPLLQDSSPHVVLQAILSIGASSYAPHKAELLANIATQRIEDEWFRLAILCSLTDATSAQRFKDLLDKEADFWKDSTEAKKEFLASIKTLIE